MNVLRFGLAILQVAANLKTVFGEWIKTPIQAYENLRGGN